MHFYGVTDKDKSIDVNATFAITPSAMFICMYILKGTSKNNVYYFIIAFLSSSVKIITLLNRLLHYYKQFLNIIYRKQRLGTYQIKN